MNEEELKQRAEEAKKAIEIAKKSAGLDWVSEDSRGQSIDVLFWSETPFNELISKYTETEDDLPHKSNQ